MSEDIIITSIPKFGVGYRCDERFGSGESNIEKVIYYEIFDLGNLDILDYLSNNMKSDKIKSIIDRLIVIHKDDLINCAIINIRENFIRDAKNLICDLVKYINIELSMNLKYVLWLCDFPTDVIDEYRLNIDDYIKAYPKSNVILSDLGKQGKLYAYEEIPEFIEALSC